MFKEGDKVQNKHKGFTGTLIKIFSQPLYADSDASQSYNAIILTDKTNRQYLVNLEDYKLQSEIWYVCRSKESGEVYLLRTYPKNPDVFEIKSVEFTNTKK